MHLDLGDYATNGDYATIYPQKEDIASYLPTQVLGLDNEGI